MVLVTLAFGFTVAAPAAKADISGNSSAICGGLIMTVDDLQKAVREGLAPSDFSPLTFADANVAQFTRNLDRFGEKPAKEARKKIATYMSRTGMPGMRTSAMVFNGEGAEKFLKSSAIAAREIGNQAEKNRIFKKWVIGIFGTQSLIALAGIPHLLEMSSDKWWYIIPQALLAVPLGMSVVKSLLRLKGSTLDQFMVKEFAKIGVVSQDSGLHMLSITGKSTSEFATQVTLEDTARAPWAEQVVIDNRPIGLTSVKRILAGKNPLTVTSKTAHVDLIAMPYGNDGQRQILVLIAEGF